MADPVLEFDPAAEATGTALTITGGNYGLTSFSAPAPPPKLQWAGSVDTEGSALAARAHENRVITIGLDFYGSKRVLFGTDCPFDPQGGPLFIRETIKALDGIKLKPQDRRRIYFGNALQMLKLRLPVEK